MSTRFMRIASITVALAGAFMAPAFADPKLTDWAAPTADNIRTIVAAMTLEEKARFVSGDGMGATPIGCAGNTHAIERLGIPAIMLSDGPAGLRLGGGFSGNTPVKYATAWPNSSLIASSWDRGILADVGRGYARDSLAYGVDIVLGPGLNIHRSPLDGRNFEYYSEDPYLVAQLAKVFVEAMQADGIGACLKHWAVNSQENNRAAGDSYVSERAIREIYTPGFLAAAPAAWSVMASYNKVNGTQAAESALLLEEILRKDGGFTGLVMSDWGAYHNPISFARGFDLNEPGGDKPGFFLGGETSKNPAHVDILAAVKAGAIREADLDRAIGNILSVVVRTRTFKAVQAMAASGKPYALSDYTESFRTKTDLEPAVVAADVELARRAAAQSFVLLKNDKATLPLAAKTAIALAGQDAYLVDVPNMRAGLVFEGAGSGQVNVREMSIVTPIAGLSAAGFKVLSQAKDGARLVEGLSAASAAQAAKEAGVAVVLIGRPGQEGSDILSMELTAAEKALIKTLSEAFHKARKRVVVLLNTASAVEVASWEAYADAIMWIGLPGQEAGNALSDVLSGAVNPSGKLAETWPVRYADVPGAAFHPLSASVPALYGEDIYVGYRHYDTKGVRPMYAFGHGLSYTTFAYGAARVSSPTFDLDDPAATVTVSVEVTNTGKVAGREVVQLYVADGHSRVHRPLKELKGFAKTGLLAPGQKETVTFTLVKRDLSYFDEYARAWRADSGWFSVYVGSSSDMAALTGGKGGATLAFRASGRDSEYSADMAMDRLVNDRDAYNLVRDYYGLFAFDYPKGGWFSPAVPAPTLAKRASDLGLAPGVVEELVAALRKL